MISRQQILEHALALSPEDRAFVAVALEDSLASHVDQGAAFLAELQRRSDDYRAGVTTALPAEEVIAELRRRQARGTTT